MGVRMLLVSAVKLILPLIRWGTPVGYTFLQLLGRMLNIPMNRWFAPSVTSVAA